MSRPPGVPGPRGSLLLGLAGRLQRDQLGTYEQLMAEYGDVVRLVVGPPGLRRVLYLVTHPDGVEQVLAGDPDGYTKNTPYYAEIAAYLGNGLLTSGGQQWRQQRRTVAPLFTHRRTAGYVDVMADEAGHLAERWGMAAARGTPVDVDAAMVDYALRTVGRVLFGADVDDAVPVIRATFPILNEHVRRRGITPLRLPRRWPTPAQVRAAAARRALYGAVDAIIDRRSGESTAGPDLISMLLAARDPETDAPMSRQEIRDQVLIFLLAGHETTSTALTFTIQLLGRHPDVQADVHREIAEVLGGRVVRADDVAKLALTTMALKEAMRLYPPAYALGRLAEAEAMLVDVHGSAAVDVASAALAAAGDHARAGAVLADRPPLRPDFYFSIFATLRSGAVTALRRRDLAEELYVALLPLRDQLAGVASTSLAMRPVAHTLAELARLMGRTAVAAEHLAQAITIAERWQAPVWRTDASRALAELRGRGRRYPALRSR